MNLFITSWLLSGFISLIGMWILELKNDKSNKKIELGYEHICASILILMLGYISLLIVYGAYKYEDN